METTIFTTSRGDFHLVPARELRDNLESIPAEPGVYVWLVRYGHRLLELSSYFETDDRPPAMFGEHTHLYTGCAYDLRFRIGQHIKNTRIENSSPRKSLLALEHMFSAITEVYGDHYGELKRAGLTAWIFENVVFGYELNNQPVLRETDLIYQMASPFNIAHRRQHKYSKYLMAWRAIAFPREWMKTIPLQQSGYAETALTHTRRELASAVSVK